MNQIVNDIFSTTKKEKDQSKVESIFSTKTVIPTPTIETQNNDNDTGLIQSGLAGIGSGAFKAAEGIVSTGALLLDLGLGTNEAAKVEKYFDSIDLYKQLEGSGS